MYGKWRDNKLEVVDTCEKLEVMKSRGYFVVPKSVIAGQPKTHYKDDFSLKSLLELIEEKIVILTPQQKVRENRIIEKTDDELMIEGLKEIPSNMKKEGDNIVSKSLNELYRDNIIDRDTWLNSFVRPTRNQLLNEADLIYCNALNLLNMSEAKKKEWNEYKQKLKDYTDIATAESDFPVKPKE